MARRGRAQQIAAPAIAQPKRLTSYQKAIVGAPWFTSDGKDATVVTLEKARRIGGSTAAAIRSLMMLAGRQVGENGIWPLDKLHPMDVQIVSKDFKASKLLLKEVADAASALTPIDPELECEIQAETVRMLSTGKKATAWPCSSAVRGHAGALVADEIAFWRCAEDVWSAAKPITDKNLGEPFGYPILIITTPWDSGSLAHRLMTDPALPYMRMRVDVYQAKAAGFPIDIERVRAELGIPEIFAVEYECKWTHGGDSFFPLDKLRDCQEDTLPSGWQDFPAFFGIDVGGVSGRDNTAITQWRAQGTDLWCAGVRAWNTVTDEVLAGRTRLEWQTDDISAWILNSTSRHTPITIAVDRGIMGKDLIDALKKRLTPERRKLTVVGVGMTGADQERYAKVFRRALEQDYLRIYTGTDGGGDANGDRALILELSSLKGRPSPGGKLTFATPRNGQGHADRAWSSLIGLAKAAPHIRVSEEREARDPDAPKFDVSTRVFQYHSPIAEGETSQLVW